MPGDAVVHSPEVVVDSRADHEAIRKRVAAAIDAGNRQLADLLSALPRPRFRAARLLAARRDACVRELRLIRAGLRRPAEHSALRSWRNPRPAPRSGRGPA